MSKLVPKIRKIKRKPTVRPSVITHKWAVFNTETGFRLTEYTTRNLANHARMCILRDQPELKSKIEETPIDERKPIPFFAIALLAFSFHNSAIILAPMYFMPNKILSKGTVLVVLVICFIIGMTNAFGEFMSVYDGDRQQGFRDYVLFGGIPLVLGFETADQKSDFLKSLFEETYISDITGRNNIRNKAELEELLNILSSAIGRTRP